MIGVGESGKVMACYNKTTNEKYALKVLRDAPKSRREVELHYMARWVRLYDIGVHCDYSMEFSIAPILSLCEIV